MRSREYRNFKINRIDVILNLAFVGSMLSFWRDFSTKVFPGDHGDSRVSLFWMEHWFQFFQNNVNLRDIPVLHPTSNMISGSDAFLIQGSFHSIFRFLGFDLGASFILALTTIHIIGSYSAVAIVRKIDIAMPYKLMIVILFGTMTPFWLSRNHAQLLVFPLLGWIIFFLLSYLRSRRFINLALATVISFCILMSAGYAIAFVVFFIVVLIVSLAFLEFPRYEIWQLLKSVPRLHWLGVLLISSPFVYVFQSIYYAKDSIIGVHSKSEILFYSPSLFDLINIPPSVMGIEKYSSTLKAILNQVNELPNPTGAYGGSFSFFTFGALFVVSGLVFNNLLRRGWITSPGSFKVLSLLVLSLFLSYALILKDGRNQSVWAISFANLPLFESIRVMSRFALLASLIIPFILGLGLWELRKSVKGKVQLDRGVFLIALILFLGQPVSYYGNFHSSEITVLSEIEGKLKSECDSFYLLNSNPLSDEIQPWLVSGDALALATRVGIPTINGASSFFPSGYPIELFSQKNKDVTLIALKSWISDNQLTRVCLIDYTRTLSIPVLTKVESFRVLNLKT